MCRLSFNCPVHQQYQPVLATPACPGQDTCLLEHQSTVSGWVVGTPLHVLTFLCLKTTAATFMLPGYQHDHIMFKPLLTRWQPSVINAALCSCSWSMPRCA